MYKWATSKIKSKLLKFFPTKRLGLRPVWLLRLGPYCEPVGEAALGIDSSPEAPQMRALAVGSQRRESLHAKFQRLKDLNARIASLQHLVQDYSYEMMPEWIGFSTTTFCNLSCPHCQTHGTEETRKIFNSQRWADDLVERLARESLPFAYEFSLSLNGEPLATPHLRRRLAEFAQYGARLHLTTNGTLLTPRTLSLLLPIARTISISIDGATKRTCEAIRLGSDFVELLNNTRMLTRSCELLGEDAAPDIRLACTVMASNVRDMPEMVRLAHALRVPSVDFYNLVIFFSHLRDEDLALHKPLYNAYHKQTLTQAKRLGIAVNLPPPFPGVVANADLRIEGSALILGQLPDNYYDQLPTAESLIDSEAIEAGAAEVAAAISEPQVVSDAEQGKAIDEECARLEDVIQKLRARHGMELERLRGAHEEVIPFCENLFRRTFIGPDGSVAPCCIPGRPNLGNANRNSIAEIYNGGPYNAFRRQFASPTPPDCCKSCPALISVPKQRLLDRVVS